MKDDLQEIFKLAAQYYYKKYRKEGGNQDRLAKKLGVTQSYVSSVITGTKSASLDLQSQIGRTLSGRQFEEFLAIGRRIKNGLDPEIHDAKKVSDSVESLISRLSYYVVDHKRIEGKLIKMRDFYEMIVENIQAGVIVFDANDDITFLNRDMEKIIGEERGKFIGTNYFERNEHLPDRNIDALLVYYMKARNIQKPVFYENICVTASGGNDIWLTGWMIPLKKENRYDGMILTARDMTRLQKLNQSLLATTEYIPHAVAIALQDHENSPVTSFHFNRAGMEIFGLAPHEEIDDDIQVAMPAIAEKLENGAEWLAFATQNLSGAEFAAMEIIVKGGRKFTWESKALRYSNGNYCGRYVSIKEKKEEGD
jgi:PAS domain S-box-containing protein